MWSRKLEKIHHDTLSSELRIKDRKDRKAQVRQSYILKTVQRRLQETNRLITIGNVILNALKDRLRLKWLKNLGKDLKDIMRRIITINMATYHTVVSIQQTLAARPQVSPVEEPFLLEDAIGRIAPFHLKLICSWDAFQSVLEIRFRDLQGALKVRKREYALQDQATGKQIDMQVSWERAFLPGQRINMAMIFKQAAKSKHCNTTKTTCPKCGRRAKKASDAEIKW